MEKLAGWLKAKRLKSNYDVRELSLQSCITTAQISRIENNKSGITLNALVGLGYGLDFELPEVLKQLNIRSDPKLLNTKVKRDNALPIPQIGDAYAMWLFYRDEPQKAKALMYDGYHQAQIPVGSGNTVEMQKSFDVVWEALQESSDESSALPYPPEIELDHFRKIHSHGGAITHRDLGVSLAMMRMENDLSQRELAEKTKISHSVISRLERGYIDRVFLDYIFTLDKVLALKGELIAFAWAAGEYQSGISLLKYLNEKNLAQRKLNYTNWDLGTKAWVDTFIAICRWHHVRNLPPTWWMTVQREIAFFKK
jgi:transcriptional regulator with XRE-family HTH domain